MFLLNQEPCFVFSARFFFVLSSQNDRMAADMAFELRKTNVACLSLWPGPVMTENVHDVIHSESKNELVQKENYMSFRTCIAQILVRIILLITLSGLVAHLAG